MRNLLLAGWLLVPIGAWAFHEGPGQQLQELEAADALLVAAHDAAKAGQWDRAIASYEEALGELPTETDTPLVRATANRIRLEMNKARMKASGLPTAREELGALVEELESEADTDPKLLAEARQALARTQFYTTWLMRLEGLDRAEWEPEIEAARQNWRLLAEQSNESEAATHRTDLEAAIRLSRIEIEDLQGLPLPGE